MIFSRTETLRVKKLNRYYNNAYRTARIKVITFWVLFIPVYTRQEIITILDD